MVSQEKPLKIVLGGIQMKLKGKFNKLSVGICVMMLVAALVTGCAKQEKPPSAQPGPKEAIRMGYLTSYTGEMGAFGVPQFNAAKLAIEEINAVGGVLGREIQLFTEDDQSSVEQGIRAARKLITTNRVIAINGPFSDIVLGIMDLAKENKVVIISPAAGTFKLDKAGGDYVFRTCASDTYDGKVIAHFLKEQGCQKIAVMFENDEGRRSVAGAVKEWFEKLGGKVVAEVPFNPGQTTYYAELKRAFDPKPEVLWLGAGQEAGPVIIKNWKQRGYGGRLMVSGDLATPEIFRLVDPKSIEGMWTEVPSAKTDSPEFQRFAQAFRQKFGAKPGGAFETNAYDAMNLLALAVQIAGEASGEAISKHIRKVAGPPGVVVRTFEEGLAELKKGNDINYEGVSGPVDLDEYGNVAGSTAVWEVKEGKWVEIKYYPAGSF